MKTLYTYEDDEYHEIGGDDQALCDGARATRSALERWSEEFKKWLGRRRFPHREDSIPFSPTEGAVQSMRAALAEPAEGA